MIPHFTESPSFHFLDWAGLSGINSNPHLKEREREREVGGGAVGGIKAERIKTVRAKEEDPTKQTEEFGTLVNS